MEEEYIQELEEIQEELREIVSRLRYIANTVGDRSALSYCIPQIEMAIDNNHDYLGSGTYTIEDMINSLEDRVGEE